ncbi:MAG: regulator of ribonuclease activity A [Granulosicoccus sp.]|jgi:regulator of ribonuclease activity A
MPTPTADLCDKHIDRLQVAEPIFKSFGKLTAFEGEIHTLKLFEDNTLVRAALEKSGHGKVLVIDGGGSLRCALLGDNIASLILKNGWAGVIVFGCIRDSAVVNIMEVAIKALNTNPTKSFKRNEGQENILVRFAGVAFKPGCYLYSDEDGLVVSDSPLSV